MFGKKQQQPLPQEEQGRYHFTNDEIDLLSECITRTENYYKGLLMLKQDWNAEQSQDAIAILKVKLRMLDELQDKTTYIKNK